MLYRIFLKQTEPTRGLHLAVPQDTVEDLFCMTIGRGFIEDERGKVFGYDGDAEGIREWLP